VVFITIFYFIRTIL